MYKNILITGGTGSFGKKMLDFILHKYKSLNKVVIFSRDELKQHEMKIKYFKHNKKLRFILGDVRDYTTLKSAFYSIDLVIHAAALKQVDTAEYNPFEFIQTNVIGAQNVIRAALDTNVKKVVALSTDKASSPINLYGATKLCSDKLFAAADHIKGKKNISFSIVRYGNVAASRGSIIPILIDRKKNNLKFELTDKRMTRFNITLDEAIDMVDWSIKHCKGGEIVVPNLKSYNLPDLARAVCNKTEIIYSKIRPGEKLHEEMISEHESKNTFRVNKYFLILNPIYEKIYKYYKKNFKKVPDGFKLSSDKTKKLSIKELQTILHKIHKIKI